MYINTEAELHLNYDVTLSVVRGIRHERKPLIYTDECDI